MIEFGASMCRLKAQVRKLQAVGPGDRLSVRKSLMPSDLANILGAGMSLQSRQKNP